MAATLTASRKTWYEATATERDLYPALKGNISCDVCVVGGGLTGVSAALHAAEGGKKVVLLEASNIGYGATGRSGAPLTSGFGSELEDVIESVGEEKARQLWQMTIDGRNMMMDRLRAHNIDCGYTRGVIYVSRTQEGDKYLKRKVGFLNPLFQDDKIGLMSGKDLKHHIKSEVFDEAGRYESGGHFHPLNFLTGLAKAAEAAGVMFYENSPVEAISTEGAHPVVHTEHGEVMAEHVFVCGNAYMEGLMPPHRTRTVTTGVFQLVTEPLPIDLVAEMMPYREAVIDVGHVSEYFQIMPDNRLVFGGPDAMAWMNDETLTERTMQRVLEIFPQMKGIEPVHLWRGFVGVTMNFLPVFERPAANILMVHGFNGHGLVVPFVGGKLMADAVLGKPEGFDAFAGIQPARLPSLLRNGHARLVTYTKQVKIWFGK